MPDIRLIALDLDGTLLAGDKTLPERNKRALEAAAANGVYIVPTTGRFYDAMPEVIRSLPFVRYCITMNGAEVLDVKTGEALSRAEIPNALALRLCEFFNGYPVIYDCYMTDKAFMTATMREHAADYINVPYFLAMVKTLRRPVPSLQEHIREDGHGVQKMQCFSSDHELLKTIRAELEQRFPELSVTSSIPDNLEINIREANKGHALLAMAEALGIPREGTMSFGDGLNDLSMIEAAGVGVAMANSIPEVLGAADYVTTDNDSAGVAAAMEKFCNIKL